MTDDSILRLREDDEAVRSALVARARFPTYWWLPGYTEEERRTLLSEQIRSATSAEDHEVLVLTCGGTVAGYASVRKMPWDSEHFGIPVFRLDAIETWGERETRREQAKKLASGVIEAVRREAGKAIHAWVPMDAIAELQALEDAGFRTMDVLTTWVFEHGKQKIPALENRCVLRGAKETDIGTFKELAREAYRDTPDRFHSDARLSAETCDDLYGKWIENSCSGAIADHVVVAEVDGRPAGYTTIRLDHPVGNEETPRSGGMILSAVASWAEGKGLYTSMIREGLRWLEEKGVRATHLGTQVNNLPVQRAWAKLGFRLAKAGPSVHFWLE